MPVKDLGTKYTCFKCGTKFYDMKKPEPLCPKCGADQRQAVGTKPAPAEKRVRAPARPVEPEVEEHDAPEAEVDEDAEVEDDDEDEK
jgi:uncharacterized protein (TIGR02300 family)